MNSSRLLLPLFVTLVAAGSQTVLFAQRSVVTRTSLSQDQADSSLSFIDAHVHLNNPEMQLRLMHEYGNRRAVVFWGRNSDNQQLVAWSQQYPGRFIPFASVSPERRSYRKHWENNDPQLLEDLEIHLQQGHFHGIGEMSIVHFPSRGFPEADYSPLHPLMQGVMKLAGKYDVPVNIHCEITRIGEFEVLLRAYPEVTVIWAHGGYTPFFLAKRMLADHSNLVYELSARTWKFHPRSPDYTILSDGEHVWPRWLELIEAHPRRFLVGTDASHHDLQRDRGKVASVRNLLGQLSDTTRQLVAHENLRRLLKL